MKRLLHYLTSIFSTFWHHYRMRRLISDENSPKCILYSLLNELLSSFHPFVSAVTPKDQNMFKKSKLIFSGNAAIAKLRIDLLTLDGNLRQSILSAAFESGEQMSVYRGYS